MMPLLRVGKTLKGSKPQGRRCRKALGLSECRVFGEPKALCGGLVLGLPLKRSRSLREDPGKKCFFLGGLEREDPEARPLLVKGKRGALNQCRR